MKTLGKLSELFPTLKSFVIFVCYIVFCVGQGILVTASKSKDGYDYNTVTVVLLTDIMKLILAFCCYIKDNTLGCLIKEIKGNIRILLLYLIPSFLYCIYNNLAFINLSHFDPTSYLILLQLRVVITGVFFQIIFNKILTKIQWLSLVLLTCGCTIQQIDWNHLKALWSSEGESSSHHLFFSIYLFLIIVQTFCSCFAGVYNEHLLKEAGSNVNVFIQNIFMYLDSIFWNMILSAFSFDSKEFLFQPLVITIIVNNSLVGITTSLFLKSFNSILKTFASAMEVLLAAVSCWVIFGIEIKLNTIVAIVIVSCSLYVYSKNPVDSQKKQTQRTNEDDRLRLLQEV